MKLQELRKWPQQWVKLVGQLHAELLGAGSDGFNSQEERFGVVVSPPSFVGCFFPGVIAFFVCVLTCERHLATIHPALPPRPL